MNENRSIYEEEKKCSSQYEADTQVTQNIKKMFIKVGIERSGQEKRILFTYNRKIEIQTCRDEMIILSLARY